MLGEKSSMIDETMEWNEEIAGYTYMHLYGLLMWAPTEPLYYTMVGLSLLCWALYVNNCKPKVFATGRTQRSESNSMRTVTIGDSSEDEEQGVMDAITGRDVIPFSGFLNCGMSITEHTSKAWMGIIAIAWKNSRIDTIFEHNYRLIPTPWYPILSLELYFVCE